MRFDINNMREIAYLKGGKCLSKEYIDNISPLKWMCAKGHTWDASYSTVRTGSWCRQCAKDEVKAEYLEEIKQIAKSKKGICLSDVYINNHTHLKFQCAEGHTWLANANNIKTGYWCPNCAGYVKLKLQVFKDYAKTQGGKCLSTVYVNIDAKLKWQCDQGHTWEASGDSVKNRHGWCPVCSHRIKNTVQDMKRIAKERGGKFLSKEYDPYNKMKWECDKGHTWYAKATKIRLGQWCRLCANERMKYTVEDMQQIAKEKGGKLLSKEYDSHDKLKWQCDKGHIWFATAESIRQGYWCHVCGHHFVHTVKDMQKLAKEKGGKFLSTEYDPLKKLRWQCDKGHIWLTTAHSVKNGHWCHVCNKCIRYTLKDMQRIAKERGGKFLSEKYDTYEKLKWQCAKGHIWYAPGRSIIKGTWCRLCAYDKMRKSG